MKRFKVTSLFFIFLLFFYCQKKTSKDYNNLNNNSKIKHIYTSNNYKKLSLNNKIKLSKKIFIEQGISSSDKYLILNNISFLYGKLNKYDSAIFFCKKNVEFI